jgi:uncharacterized protein YkwD
MLSAVAGALPYGGGSGGGGIQAADPLPAPAGSSIPSSQDGGSTPVTGTGTATGTNSAGSPTGKTTAPRPSPSPTKPSPTATTAAPTPTRTTAAPTTPVVTATPVPTPSATAPATADEIAAARAQILTMVNEQRTTAGCKVLTADPALDTLAQNFSDDMAARGFFDHTDPDGNDPWDRATALGITNLGGENIARGQVDAQAVMDAWMNSIDHRANILDCDYTTLGVGIHFGPDGPWWTQDFGY